jgi:hypothetical protein
MNAIELLKKQNDEFRLNAVTKLIGGGVQDYAEYRELVGVIRGLDHANLNLQDLKTRLEKEIDD